MNPFLRNLNRIEFVITLACTGRCKHCSQGEHSDCGEYLSGGMASEIVRKICGEFPILSIMTFGGEPLLHPDVVCNIHTAAKDMGIPKRQLITNGFFSKNADRIMDVAAKLAGSGVNDILLSVDTFHQETIPLETVKRFAKAVQANGIPLRTNPAWLGIGKSENPYDPRTLEILKEFEQMGVTRSDGNAIFPSGNAVKYLGEYFDLSNPQKSPYEEDPADVRALCISPNGDALDGNVYQTDIMNIIENYRPRGA